jgi:hypothetical protein
MKRICLRLGLCDIHVERQIRREFRLGASCPEYSLRANRPDPNPHTSYAIRPEMINSIIIFFWPDVNSNNIYATRPSEP